MPRHPLSVRRACLVAMSYPFTDMFRHECGNRLYRDRDRRVPVTVAQSLCFMWWDILYHGMAVQPTGLLPSVIGVLTTLCRDSSFACVESAFHGLGHFYVLAPDEVQCAIVETIKARMLPKGLREYGERAACGDIQ
jgi:hypothetical protein